MIEDLPTKIKKMIFARVRHMDLYEVSGVSKEWWTLTMGTYRAKPGRYSHFFNFQVTFCSKMMPKEEGWKDWMFAEFRDDETIELFGPLDKTIIEYLDQKGVRVCKLIYTRGTSNLSNLQVLFPHLQTLDFTPSFFDNYDGEAIVLPEDLKYLRLTINNDYPRSHLLDVFKHLECVDSLHVFNNQQILFDNISFDRLKYLRLDMSKQSTVDIKSLFARSKQLSIVRVHHGLIDKEWLGLFPTNIMKIQLEEMRLDKSLLPLFGTAGALVERQLMRFVCQDWTKIRLFKSSNWSCASGYSHSYVCKPQLLEEELEIFMYQGELPSGLLDREKLQLKVLKLSKGWDSKLDLDIVVPKSVQHFELTAHEFEHINFAVLFEDISTIEKLRINSIYDGKIQFSDFPYAVNLVSLDISLVDDITLESILRNCPSLKQLSLKWPHEMSFCKLPADLKSPSVKQHEINEPGDSLTNILGHFPYLVDLRLRNVNMETVTIADLALLTTVEFVWISFKNSIKLVPLILVVNCLHLLSCSHLMLGYSSFLSNERFACVMGREKAFFRRYSSLNWKNDFIELNIRHFWNLVDSEGLLYLKGVPTSHISSLSNSVKITNDLQEFVAKALAEIMQENNNTLVLQ